MPIRPVWNRVDELKQTIENLSVEDLRVEQLTNEDLLVVDIREVQERVDKGAIPGSVHVPRGMLEFWADPTLSYYRTFFREDRRTVLYCAGGGRSVLAAKALRDMGYRNIAQLEVGFDGWRDAGGIVDDIAAGSKWVRRS